MKEYRLQTYNKHEGLWYVIEGHISYGSFVEESTPFYGTLADCYAWIKCKQEGLFII